MAEGMLSKIFSREGAKTLQGADNWVLQGLGGLLGAGYGAYDYDYPDTIQGWGGLLGNVGNAAAKGLENTINEAAMDATMQVAGASDGKKVTDLALGLLGTNALVPFRAPRGSLPAHVWQGSPHKYGPEGARESLKHIGKGEGAQAYGWGRYDAGARSVGQQYQGNLSYKDTVRNFREALPDDAEFEDVMDLVGTGHFSEYQDRVLKELAENDWLGFDYPSQAISAAYRDIDNYDPTPSLRAAIKDSGYLYKHDLPDEDIARYLDWDAPLSEQPESVRKALEARPDIIKQAQNNGFYTEDPTGREIYESFAYLGDKAKTSEALRKAGIPGLKYYDGMSRGKGEGTRNYVTWDQDVLNRMKLLERNGEPMGLLNK